MLLNLNVQVLIFAVLAPASAVAVSCATNIFQGVLASLPAFYDEFAIVEVVDVALNFLFDVGRIHLPAFSRRLVG